MIGGQLQNSGFLTGLQMREQNDLAIAELQRIMVEQGIVLVDAPGARREAFMLLRLEQEAEESGECHAMPEGKLRSRPEADGDARVLHGGKPECRRTGEAGGDEPVTCHGVPARMLFEAVVAHSDMPAQGLAGGVVVVPPEVVPPASPVPGAVCWDGAVVLPVVSPLVPVWVSATGGCMPPVVAMSLRFVPR